MALDIFLGYMAYGRQEEYSGITELEITRALERAREAGITVSTELPRAVLAAPFLSIKPRDLDAKAVAQKLLGTALPEEQQSSKELSVWTHGDKRVTWVASGAVLYIDESEEPAAEAIDARAAGNRVEAFLRDKGLFPSDARLDFSLQVAPGEFIVQYYQDYQGNPLFGGYITASVDGGGVDRLRILWFNPIGLGPKKRAVVPATDCLVKIAPLVEEKLGKTSTLTAIRMGYLSEGIDARQWDTFPVWRFEFEGGYYVYVNGYTGEIDKVEEVW